MEKKLVGALMFGQSGGPSSVINASAAGVFTEALKQDCITAVYGAAHGIKGVLDEEFYDISQEDMSELMLLKNTPSSALGSVRYKLKDVKKDDTDYKRLLEVFKKYNIRYFFYNGGNDSMDTCNKISKFMKKNDWEMRVMGVPKTIDNDLFGTDHCPGYASAAKYVATTMMELKLDANVYDTPMITVVEIMGRHAGWLTAAASLANYKGLGPDLIYLPEVPFNTDKFLADVEKKLAENNGKCMIAISEGIANENGELIAETLNKNIAKDSFGHAQLGGVGAALSNLCKEKFGHKTRAIEFSLMQRCGAHLASKVDVEEAFKSGAAAVKYAVKGTTDKMVVLKRATGANGKYKCKIGVVGLSKAANTEKKIPAEWIINDGTMLSQDYVDYALPLIQGDCKAPLEDGLPRFAHLKKVLVKK
ncbi:MAG: 6-phosphofructokinase [Clostridia bacterium]|nr:6-phosphofructokinase [Clostridia bacterium]MDY4082633.1 6-phosphofructokinase [Eubacteriales bacterium]